jgi:ubiquinone/menaquinone biosynthesis C-methylase UbiE
LPAAGHDLFLPLYDPLVRLLGGERARRELINQARIEDRRRALDIGCGTGTLVMMLKKQFPAVEVAGVDPDEKALRRAKTKATRAGVSLQLDQGFADELPYEDSSFDRVLSSLMFHHLEEQDREKNVARSSARPETRRFVSPGRLCRW